MIEIDGGGCEREKEREGKREERCIGRDRGRGRVASIVVTGEDATGQLIPAKLEHAALGVHVLQHTGPYHQGLTVRRCKDEELSAWVRKGVRENYYLSE